MKPYLQIPIQECGESLVPIPDQMALMDPHPYQVLGAPYGDKSPYYLRHDVLQRLLQAQQRLQDVYSNWRIQIFDAYRPIPVQQFMVDYAYREILGQKGIDPHALTEEQQHAIWHEVYQFWAVPSADLATPPPHSTGAALDVTLVNDAGIAIDMGSPIDELSLRSYPDYFTPDSLHRPTTDDTPIEWCDRFHHNRQLLCRVMRHAGFQRHPNEWWHFSFGDQMWAWLMRTDSDTPDMEAIAFYGRI